MSRLLVSKFFSAPDAVQVCTGRENVMAIYEFITKSHA